MVLAIEYRRGRFYPVPSNQVIPQILNLCFVKRLYSTQIVTPPLSSNLGRILRSSFTIFFCVPCSHPRRSLFLFKTLFIGLTKLNVVNLISRNEIATTDCLDSSAIFFLRFLDCQIHSTDRLVWLLLRRRDNTANTFVL